jgi:hypothetical protein
LSLPCPAQEDTPLDLAGAPRFGAFAARAGKLPPGGGRREIQDLTAEAIPRLRMHTICEVYRKLETPEIAGQLKTAARLAVRHDPAGLRLLFGFLEVRRPGVEVMRQIEKLSSLERVALRITSGSWSEPDEGQETSAGLITETFRAVSRIGALGHADPETTTRPDLLREMIGRLRAWFRRSGSILESGRKLPRAMMETVVAVADLEIRLTERRMSGIASRIDPYDGRGISRLMPILSFYDQDIEHLKTVVSRLDTYYPFQERLITMEQALSTREIDSIEKALRQDADGLPMAEILSAMRSRPLLDRELGYLVSVVHRLAALRARELEAPEPDVLSVLYDVLVHARGGGIDLVMEPEVLDALSGSLDALGVERTAPGRLHAAFREDRAAEFVQPDGLPHLALRPAEKAANTSIRDLVQRQLGNDAFMMGLLNNTRVTGLPGIVTMIAIQSRSVRVLSKIASARHLHTGPANKDVPRLLLMSPARIPVNTLKPLVHVRFVSRVDLERLAKSGTEIRSEVIKEIALYLKLLKK